MLYFLIALSTQFYIIGACVDSFFCNLITEQVSCYTTDIEERAAVIKMCPLMCEACSGTQTPTGSPTIEDEEEHDETLDTIILSVLAFLMLVLVIASLNTTFCSFDEADGNDTPCSSFPERSSPESLSLEVYEYKSKATTAGGFNSGKLSNGSNNGHTEIIKAKISQSNVCFYNEGGQNKLPTTRGMSVDDDNL